ncbi:unnamed protein product [Cylicocyclus nassatus]|uniref:PAN-3 domain-containing protein n=1 Tax=Cylicocyclus nassatus TaxID=53992 RepID=A0AA36GP63_CYLNA|nr:unnamed protein product [Cylicocyclus nassatus]
MSTKNTVIFIVTLMMQIYTANSNTFTPYQGNFTANFTYELPKESEELCLRTCFEESDCTFVQYNENVCTIFKSGEVNQVGRGNVYALDRQLVLPTCERPLPLAQNVEFQQLPEPVEAQSEARKAQLLAMNTTASLTIIDIIGLSGSRFFLKDVTKMPDGAIILSRLVFAKEPNPECVSVPVFQRASQRRLYFGDVYNVTGYTFLDAYAFTGRCACAGICCGQVRIYENFEGGSYYYTYYYRAPFKTEMNQILYIAGILKADNATSSGMRKSC